MLVLNAITGINLIVLFSVLYFRKHNPLPNKILALLVLTPAINAVSNVVTLSGNLYSFPVLFFFGQMTAFVFAPLVYMYVLLMTGRKINLRYPLYFITLLGMLGSLLLGLDFAFAMSPIDQEEYLKGVTEGPYPVEMGIANSVFIVMQQIYFTVAAIHVYRYRKQLADTVSSYETTQVNYVTVFIVLIWVLNILTLIAYSVLSMLTVEYIVLPIILNTIFLFIVFYGFYNKSIFTQGTYRVFLQRNSEAPQEKQSVLEGRDPLTALTGIAIENHVDSRGLYLQPHLTSSMLAKELGTDEKVIAKAIRGDLRKSFYDLVNEKRAIKAKAMLSEKNGLSVELVARNAGFVNSDAMNKAFARYRIQAM